MLITLEDLEQAIPGSSDKARMRVVRELNERMQLGEINSPLRKAAFIAMFAYDSENLHVLPNVADYFKQWKQEYCNHLADIGSITEITKRMVVPKVEGIEHRKALYDFCKIVFGVV